MKMTGSDLKRQEFLIKILEQFSKTKLNKKKSNAKYLLSGAVLDFNLLIAYEILALFC